MKDIGCKYTPSDVTLRYEEWIVTNGLGGYACGSFGGSLMRKYNGLLVAALKAPFGRTLMLNYVADSIIVEGQEIFLSQLAMKELPERHIPEGIGFRLDNTLPFWRYYVKDLVVEKSIWMAHRQNTTYISYQLISGKSPVQLKWRPYLHFRHTEEEVNLHVEPDYEIRTHSHGLPTGYEIHQDPYPKLKLLDDKNSSFTIDLHTLNHVFYEFEEKRGNAFFGSLTSPGYFLTPIQPGEKIAFTASVEDWNVIGAMSPEESLIAEKQRCKGLLKSARPLSFSKTPAKLILAADQFIVTPMTREQDFVRLQAMGEELRTIIAGYPWFGDWGRDTMISLEGLTLTTGRPNIARAILRTFVFYIKDGLIPNMFPDGETVGLYHTADATLWFFHAVDRYVTLTGDEDFLEFILPKFQQIIDHHIKGTSYGIKMDSDGLLSQGQAGYQLTWMDAKVKDWVVTPRRGKAVEINALWFNALKLMELWTKTPSDLAKKCQESFNNRFWYEEGGYLYDVIDGEEAKDTSLRPNQILSISLRFPVLNSNYWKPVVDSVHKDLLTNYGLRTLSPSDPKFKAYYKGDLLSRDAAYHQGTVWPWLIGPFIDAWLKVYPEENEKAKLFLATLESHIDESCVGTIGEIFDAKDPFQARGCFAQAWSVAEFLRAYAKVHPDIQSHKQGG